MDSVMIGIYAILMDAGFVAMALFFLAGVSWGWIRSLRRKPQIIFNKNDRTQTPAELFVILVLVVIWCAAAAGNTASRLRFYFDMCHLQPGTVERIEIGSQTVTDRQQIEDIVAAINHASWYWPHGGYTADKVSLAVKLISGKQYNFEVRRYLRGEGAELRSRPASGWYNGEVFCRRLPASLMHAGVKLPDCYTYFGKPQRCAVQ
jgi:hypothetical protein